MTVTFFDADVTQFLMPDGRVRNAVTRLPMEVRDAYDDMERHGCRLEAEILRTGEVSVTIASPHLHEDLDIEVIPNNYEVQQAIVAMLRRGLWKRIGVG